MTDEPLTLSQRWRLRDEAIRLEKEKEIHLQAKWRIETLLEFTKSKLDIRRMKARLRQRLKKIAGTTDLGELKRLAAQAYRIARTLRRIRTAEEADKMYLVWEKREQAVAYRQEIKRLQKILDRLVKYERQFKRGLAAWRLPEDLFNFDLTLLKA